MVKPKSNFGRNARSGRNGKKIDLESCQNDGKSLLILPELDRTELKSLEKCPRQHLVPRPHTPSGGKKKSSSSSERQATLAQIPPGAKKKMSRMQLQYSNGDVGTLCFSKGPSSSGTCQHEVECDRFVRYSFVFPLSKKNDRLSFHLACAVVGPFEPRCVDFCYPPTAQNQILSVPSVTCKNTVWGSRNIYG